MFTLLLSFYDKFIYYLLTLNLYLFLSFLFIGLMILCVQVSIKTSQVVSPIKKNTIPFQL
jgi:hypothetical protein